MQEVQEVQVLGWGGPEWTANMEREGITSHPISPATLAEFRAPSIQIDQTPWINNHTTPEVPPLSSRDLQAFHERQIIPPALSPEELRVFYERQEEFYREVDESLAKDLPPLEHKEPETWTNSDIRVYTRVGSGPFKFWGIRDEDETTEEFWAKHDPEDTRHKEAAGVIGPSGTFEPFENTLEAQPPSDKTLATHQQFRQARKVKASHRVKKPDAPTSPQRNRTTRRSSKSKQKVGNQVSLEQAWGNAINILSHDRPTRRQQATRARKRQEEPRALNPSGSKPAPSKAAKTSQAGPRTRKSTRILSLPENRATLQEHRQSQSQASAKLTPRKKIKTGQRPPLEGNAKIKKRTKSAQPSAAPSMHPMRTRARGPAEKIQMP